MVVVSVLGEGETGVGYTYGAAACASVVEDHLRDVVVGSDPTDLAGTWGAMRYAFLT